MSETVEYHDLHCNANRQEPMGCRGCSCFMYKRAVHAESKDRYKFRVVFSTAKAKNEAKFLTKDFALLIATKWAFENPGEIIYLEDYEKETTEEISAEAKILGRFPLMDRFNP